MTDERLSHDLTSEPPLHLRENAERIELVGRLAGVMQAMVETARQAEAAKYLPSKLDRNNLQPVLDVIRRQSSK